MSLYGDPVTTEDGDDVTVESHTDIRGRMTIEEFIEARIAEDERVARKAGEQPGPIWDHALRESYPGIYTHEIDCEEEVFARVDYEPTADHIVSHDPARVLRQCAAMRSALETFETFGEAAELPTIGWIGLRNGVIRSLAAIWSDHPDYRDDWKQADERAVGVEQTCTDL
ncbi:hypothetical protein GPX89_13290 [Nocardia sp. ET3-3]|uniref:Uncharacterized protein n=1 Tax=Nocardia terrae TaxID=2675851 RepID=A0A7K1UV56_9NOCA|nr:DUF6221 family protein [Nocardia terrae]MVU78215.1 hypothetical protein [Nocardia terrae]